MRIENSTATAHPAPFSSYPSVRNCLGDLASILLPKLVEFDSIWELTNSICDRYLKPAAV